MAIKVFVVLPGNEKCPEPFHGILNCRETTKSWLVNEMIPAEVTRVLQFESGESLLSWAIFASIHVVTSASLIIRGNWSQIT